MAQIPSPSAFMSAARERLGPEGFTPDEALSFWNQRYGQQYSAQLEGGFDLAAQQGFGADFGNEVGASFVDSFAGTAYLVGEMVDSDAARGVATDLYDYSASVRDTQSDAWKQAQSQEFITQAEDGTHSAGGAWTDARAWANLGANALGFLAGTVATGGPIKGLAQGTVKRLMLRGMTRETAEKAAAATMMSVNKVSGTLAYGAAETSTVLGNLGHGIEEEIKSYDHKFLMDSPAYSVLYGDLLDGMPSLSEAQRSTLARDILAKQAAVSAMKESAIPQAMLGALGGRLTEALLSRGIGGATVKANVARGGGAEFLQEAAQGGSEQVAQNLAIQEFADPTRSGTEGLVNAAMTEGLGGVMIGGALGAVSRRRQDAPPLVDRLGAATPLEPRQPPSRRPPPPPAAPRPDPIADQLEASGDPLDAVVAGARRMKDSLDAPTPTPAPVELAPGEGAPPPLGQPARPAQSPPLVDFATGAVAGDAPARPAPPFPVRQPAQDAGAADAAPAPAPAVAAAGAAAAQTPQVRGNGQPFKSERGARASAAYKRAASTGATPQVVPVGNGFGVVTAPQTQETQDAAPAVPDVPQAPPVAKTPTQPPAEAPAPAAAQEAAPAAPDFTPTHTLASGEQVAATDEPGVYTDQSGTEIEDAYAEPIRRAAAAKAVAESPAPKDVSPTPEPTPEPAPAAEAEASSGIPAPTIGKGSGAPSRAPKAGDVFDTGGRRYRIDGIDQRDGEPVVTASPVADLDATGKPAAAASGKAITLRRNGFQNALGDGTTIDGIDPAEAPAPAAAWWDAMPADQRAEAVAQAGWSNAGGAVGRAAKNAAKKPFGELGVVMREALLNQRDAAGGKEKAEPAAKPDPAPAAKQSAPDAEAKPKPAKKAAPKKKPAAKKNDGKALRDAAKGAKLFSRSGADVTETPEFKRWFGDSKVVDSFGKPLVVHHGAPDMRGIFSEGFKAFSRGSVFFAAKDSATANSYAVHERAFDYQNAEPGVVPMYLSIKNPLRVNGKGQRWRGTEEKIEEARAAGHDGVIIYNVRDHYNEGLDGLRTAPTTIYAFFEPTQAKSAINGQVRSRVTGEPVAGADKNSGAFDPADPRISFSRNDSKAAGGMSRAALAKMAVKIAGDVPVEVVATPADLPVDNAPSDARGMLYDGKVYLVAQNIGSRAEAEVVLAHELIGHYGVEAVLAGDFAGITETIRELEANGDASVTAAAAAVDKNYPGIKGKERVQEIIAHIAEHRAHSSTVRRLISRVRAAVRRWLKAAGFRKTFKSAEIDQLLADSETYIRAQAKRNPEAFPEGHPLYSSDGTTEVTETQEFKRWFGDSEVVDENGKPLVVYHGTNANAYSAESFQTFDTRGERGGAYFSTSRDVAQQYGEDVYASYVALKNPLIVDAQGRYWANLDGDAPVYGRETEKLYQQRVSGDRATDGLLAELFEDAKPRTVRKRRASIDGSTLESIGDATDADSLAKLARKLGYDGVLVRNVRDAPVADSSQIAADTVIAFEPTQIKSAVGTRGTFDSGDPSIMRQDTPPVTETPAFKRWFGDSKVVDINGEPRVVYHGTGSNFEAFDRRHSNPESDLGAGFYFTTERGDVANNYAGEGPDMSMKIELEAERLQNEIDEETGEYYDEDAAMALAKKSMMDNEGATMPVYLSIKNPVEIGGDNPTTLDREYTEDEDGDIIDEGGSLIDFAAALREELESEDVFQADADKTLANLLSDSEELTAEEIISSLESDGYFADVTDEDGKLVSKELIRRAFAAIGFDGFIDYTVNRKFGSERVRGKAMPGMDENTVHYIAFEPTQVKSAIGNRGTFDPADPRIAFSRGGVAGPVSDALFSRGGASSESNRQRTIDAVESAVKSVPAISAERLRALPDKLRSVWLGLLGLRHIGDVSQKILPQVKEYIAVANRMFADRKRYQDEAHKIASEWGDFNNKFKAVRDDLAGLMHDATLAGIDPDKPFAPANVVALKAKIKKIHGRAKAKKELTADEAATLKSLEQAVARAPMRKGEYARLRARWEKLGRDTNGEAHVLYRKVRDAYVRRQADMEEELMARIDRIEGSENAKTAMKERLRLHFEVAKVQGPYFPLARFGDYWVSAIDADGEKLFTMYESPTDQRRAIDALKKQGAKIEGSGKKLDQSTGLVSASSGFVNEVTKILDESGGGKAAEEVKDQVYQMWLTTMPDVSVRKQFIHRSGRAGYSNEAMRAFAKQAFHGSFAFSRLRHSDKLERALSEMKDHVKGMSGENDENANAAADYFNEMLKRHQWIMEPRNAGWVSTVSSTNFAWYLGVTPAAALVNLTQTPLVALPVIGSKFGFRRTSRELTRALKGYSKGKGDIRASLNAEERAAYEQLEAEGVIDRTMTMDLAGASENDMDTYRPGVQKTMRAVGFLFHHAEVANREVTSVAAYRLARQSGMKHEAAIDYARDATYESHFDYQNANRARFMQGNAAKVLLMFRQYSLNMSYLLWRNLYKSFKGDTKAERAQARRLLTGVLGMHAIAAGTTGLPLFGVVAMVANAAASAFGDDDEEYDFATEYQNFIADIAGETGGRAITHGLLNVATGGDIHSRVSLDSLWFRSPDRDLEGRDLSAYWLETIAGPGFGIVANGAIGASMINDGEVERGIEKMVPKVFRDALRAIRYASEGVNTYRGDPLVDDISGWETALQSMGITPDRVSHRYDRNSSLRLYESRILDRRRRLLNAAALAKMAGDMAAYREARMRLREALGESPDKKIRQSIRARERYSERAEGGMALSASLADELKGAVRF